jgi:hypothetical protein
MINALAAWHASENASMECMPKKTANLGWRNRRTASSDAQDASRFALRMQSAIRQNHICGSFRKGMTLGLNAVVEVAKNGNWKL